VNPEGEGGRTADREYDLLPVVVEISSPTEPQAPLARLGRAFLALRHSNSAKKRARGHTSRTDGFVSTLFTKFYRAGLFPRDSCY